MGEMADFCNDDMQDAYPEWCPFGRKTYSPKLITCRVCGEKNLHWVTTKEGWRMFNKKNEEHKCDMLTKYRKEFG